MVKSTKHDLGSVSPSGSARVRTIAVKLPADLQERILSFPFLHALRGQYPDAVLHLISPAYKIEVLNLLPFKAYFHEYDLEGENPLEVHRFAATAKIHGVDLFISLTNSWLDATLGISLRARERLGFSDDWKTLFFNLKIKRPVNHHLCEDYFALFEKLIGQEVPRDSGVSARELPPVVADWEEHPYFAVNLSPLRGDAVDADWVELIKQFRGQRLFLFAAEDDAQYSSVQKAFLAKLGTANKIVNFEYRSWIELARLLGRAQGVITYSGALAALASYVGCKSLILQEGDDPKRTGPLYFSGRVKMLEPPRARLSLPDGQVFIKPRPRFSMSEVGRAAWEFFDLR